MLKLSVVKEENVCKEKQDKINFLSRITNDEQSKKKKLFNKKYILIYDSLN